MALCTAPVRERSGAARPTHTLRSWANGIVSLNALFVLAGL
jgi:hypothetical protein